MTTALSPNEAFTAERQRQIATALDAPRRAAEAAANAKADFDQRIIDGKLRNLGNGRYQVVEPGSYDNGEILTARWDNRVEQVVILPEHNLAEANGQVALYSAAPAWHGLGQIIPGGITDIDRVLKLAHLDFTVFATPIQYTWGGELRTKPGRYVTVRHDTGESLGVIGEVYRKGGIVQNREAFEFLQDVVDRYDVIWESAGLLTTGRVFIVMRLPETIAIDPDGVNDKIVPYVALLNSFDAGSRFITIVTPWRIECGNTERFALQDAVARWDARHTSGLRDRFDEARRTMGLSVKYYEALAREETALTQTQIAIDEFRAVADELWPVEEPTSTVKEANRNRRLEKLTELFDGNAARLGRTAYCAERAFTEYMDWHKRVAPRGELKGKDMLVRATQNLEGTDDERKNKTHTRLMTLVRR